MLKSLRLRLLLMMLICIVLAVGVTAVLADRATANEFSEYVPRTIHLTSITNILQ